MIYEKENGNVGIEIENPPARLSVKGTTFQISRVTTMTGSDVVTGSGTSFTVEVAAGDQITIGGETRTIIEVTDDTHLKVNSNFTVTTGPPEDIMTVLPDILRVEDNTGEPKLVVSKKGDIGIGTDNPRTSLHIPEQGLQIGKSNQAYNNFHIVSDMTGNSRGLRLFNGNYGAGTHLLTVKVNGNVGIGTSAPGAKLSINGGLHVGGDSDPGNDNLLVDGDIAISGKHAFRGSDSWLRLNQDKAFTSGVHTPGVFAPVSLNVGGAGSWGDPGRGNVWITGNVGIGTTNPQDKLDMGSGSIRFYSGIDYQRIFANRWGLNVFTNKLPSSGLRVGEIYGSLGLYAGDGATDYNLGLVAGRGKGVGIAGDAKNPFIGNGLFIASNGRVGIGTTSPQEKLEINGSIRGNQSGALRISTGYGYVDVGPKNHHWSHFVTDRSKYYFNKEIRVNSGKIGSYAEDLSLCTSGTERIRVKSSNGNVGIGTNYPIAKLHVNGKLHLDDDITLSPSYYSVDPYGEIREATSWIYVHGIKAIGFRVNTFHGRISSKRILICKGWTLVENFNC